MKLLGFYDGGSRGNGTSHSIAGSGSVLYDETLTELWSDAHALPAATTNNVAEYTGLLRLLQHALDLARSNHKFTRLLVRGDSKLVTEQVNGTFVPGHRGWAIKADHLRPLHARAMELLWQLTALGKQVTLEHIPRELNKRADELSNVAMDSIKNENIELAESSTYAKLSESDEPAAKKIKYTDPDPDRAVAVRMAKNLDNVVYVGPAVDNKSWKLPRSKWANPIPLSSCKNNRDECLRRFRGYLHSRPELMAALPELCGKRLACFCDDMRHCHAQVLADMVNER